MISCRARLVTMDETWSYHYDRRQRNNQWSGGIAVDPAPKNSDCKNPLENFSPASIFLGSRRHPPHWYLSKGQTINAEYYSYLLVQLKDILKEKHLRNFINGFLFLHDNAPAHWTLVTQKNLTYVGFQCPYHPPYSPYLAPLDYHLFPGLNKQLNGRHFTSDA